MRQLFDGQSTNGVSDLFGHMENDKLLNIYITGVLDGATVSVQAQAPAGAYIPLNGGDFTEARMFTVEAAPFIGRFALAGAGPATDVSVWIEEATPAAQNRVSEALGR